jgi:hypothetical protein
MARPKKHKEDYKYYKTLPNQEFIKTFREVAELTGCSHAQVATTCDVALKKILYFCLSDADLHAHYEGDVIRLLADLHSQYCFEVDMLARNFKVLLKRHPVIKKYWDCH